MATAVLTATATTIAAPTDGSVSVKNTGAARVTIRNGAQVTYLRPNRDVNVVPVGSVTAEVLASDGGSGSISYDVAAVNTGADLVRANDLAPGETGAAAGVSAGLTGDYHTKTSADTTYARVIQLPVGNGTDDSAAINALLATAAGGRVRGVPGQTYKLGSPLTLPVGGNIELDMTGCTISLNAGANCQMLRNSGHATNTPGDADITVRGGLWQRGSVGGAGANNTLHSLVFQQVARLKVDNVRVTSSNGKYSVFLIACTDFEVGRCTFDTFSDGVHMTGLCKRGWVHDIYGATTDDTVAITTGDYAAYEVAGTGGSAEDITIERVHTTTVGNCVKVMPGTDFVTSAQAVTRKITVRDIKGSAVQSCVYIGCDTADSRTNNGLVDGVNVDSVRNYGSGDSVKMVGVATMRGVVLRDISSPAAATGRGVAIAGGCTITDLTVTDSRFEPPASVSAINWTSGTPTAWSTVNVLRVTNCTIKVATKSGALINTANASSVLSNLFIDNVRAEMCAWAVGAFYGTTTMHISGLSTVTADVNGWFYGDAAAVLDVQGASGLNGSTGFSKHATGTVTSRSFGLECDVNDLTRTANSMAYNTNAARSCGVGPVVCDGTNWKHLFTAATF